MSKEAYYFSHDSNARQDEKILALRMKHGWEGYGIYWALVEKLREATDYVLSIDYNVLSFDLRADVNIIKSIVEDFALFSFTEDEKGFFSNRMMRSMDKKDVSKINGIRGNLIRHGHLSKDESKELSDDEILKLNEKIKLGGESGASRGRSKPESHMKGKEKENKEKNIPPLIPPKGDVRVKTWKDDFEIYLTDLRKAYRDLVEDEKWIHEQEQFHPNIDIRLSLKKSCTNFWATEAGWMNKKKKRTKEINWKTTLINTIDMHKVYKSREPEAEKRKEPYKPAKW